MQGSNRNPPNTSKTRPQKPQGSAVRKSPHKPYRLKLPTSMSEAMKASSYANKQIKLRRLELARVRFELAEWERRSNTCHRLIRKFLMKKVEDHGDRENPE